MSDAAAAAKREPMARIRYGSQDINMPVVGKTVAEVRKMLSDSVLGWGIPADATAKSGKQELSEDHVIEANEDVQFSRRLGEKGV